MVIESRGIRRGIEVFVRDPFADISEPGRRAIVVRTYPSPSRWLVVKYESGDMEQVEESQITTMFEKNRNRYY